MLLLGGVEHALDISKKLFQENQLELSVQIDSIIFPPLCFNVHTGTARRQGRHGKVFLQYFINMVAL